MAQLRDARTSELIAEGTPLKIVTIADELGRADVLFDGVGEAFDPDAVLRAHQEQRESMEAVAADASDASDLETAAAALARIVAEGDVAPEVIAAARGAMQAARARAEG